MTTLLNRHDLTEKIAQIAGRSPAELTLRGVLRGAELILGSVRLRMLERKVVIERKFAATGAWVYSSECKYESIWFAETRATTFMHIGSDSIGMQSTKGIL